MNEILCGAGDLDDREYSDGYREEAVTVVIVTENAVHTLKYRLGNVRATAATAALAVVRLLVYADRENDRVNKLDGRRGQITRGAAERDSGAEIVLARGFEHRYVVFAAVKNSLFVNYRNTVEALASFTSYASLKAYLDVESYIYGVKAAVEGNGVYRNVCPSDARVGHADVGGSSDYVVTERGEENLHVFIAIPITARIEYSCRLNTGGIATRIVLRAVISCVCHNIDSFRK